MPQKCTICTHPRRGEIDRDLLQAGESAPVVAERYALGRESVRRHRNNHLQVSTGAVNEAKNALTIIGYAHDLYERATKLLTRAEESIDTIGSLADVTDGTSRRIQAAAATLREVRASIELLARLVTTEPESTADSTNATLDSMILEQLSTMGLAALPPGTDADIVDAVVLP